ncbi:unnamed protein product [Caenorhabditis brenneri]
MAHAAQRLPAIENFVPPTSSGQFNPNMPFPSLRGLPNQQFHPNDPRHPMCHLHRALLQSGSEHPENPVVNFTNCVIATSSELYVTSWFQYMKNENELTNSHIVHLYDFPGLVIGINTFLTNCTVALLKQQESMGYVIFTKEENM